MQEPILTTNGKIFSTRIIIQPKLTISIYALYFIIGRFVNGQFKEGETRNWDQLELIERHSNSTFIHINKRKHA